MGGRVRISFAYSAIEDLERVLAYYAEEGVPEVGRRLVAEVVGAVGALATHPNTGRVVPEFNLPDLRELIRPPFRIVYRREAGRVRVVRVWRSERLLKRPEGWESRRAGVKSGSSRKAAKTPRLGTEPKQTDRS
jgi:plasmid stabilization system protein ParE